VLYLSNFLGARNNVLGGSTAHFWSLAVEEQFYLIWPWLVLFMPRRAIPWTIGVMLLVGPLYRFGMYYATSDALRESANYPATTTLPIACLDSLGAGALLAWGMARGSPQILRRITTTCLAIGLCALTLGIALYCRNSDGVGWITVTDLGVALTTVWIIAKASRGFGGPIGWCLTFPPLIYMGTISYCVYILHPFIHNITPLLFAKLHLGIPRYSVVLLIDFSVTVAMATASWFLFERHLIRLGRSLTPDRQTRRR
jgi:peptidoglycan/LPS O-acetylase OafA/YrhL